jgi:hypothetical protein
MGTLRIGQVYRYSRPYSAEKPIIDDYPNYFHQTFTEGHNLPLLEKGIGPIGKVVGPEGERIPAILVRSSGHKAGSEDTPWQDIFDVDNGYVRYFGDNKSTNPAGLAPGNKVLYEQLKLHLSPVKTEREGAVPILFFEAETVGGRPKGFMRFQGLGIIQSVEIVTQYQPKIGYFTNYQFEFSVLSLASENEEIDWAWISARRDASKTLKETSDLAPETWRKWVTQGQVAIEKTRRKVSKLNVTPKAEQLPAPGTKEAKVLAQIYKFYTAGKKHKFELLASRVVQGLVSRKGANYREGWITQASGDGGVDFVGRIDLATGFSRVKIVVLGQAKCELATSGTNGRDIARTVARLRRGWVGAYVTTSFFTDRTQIEVLEDQYPLIMVNGLELAQETLRLMEESGFASVEGLLDELEQDYSGIVMSRRPEEILFD